MPSHRAVQSLKRSLARPLRTETPTDLIFFVTDRCNARCGHCFYRYAIDVADGTHQLGLPELERIIRSLREPLHSLVLTGGEPFLRPDLADICVLFGSLHTPGQIVIPTNGLLPERIRDQVERICASGSAPLLIQVSVDGLAATHDAIRGGKGSFERAVATATTLRSLRDRGRHLEVNIATTLSRRNLGEMEALAAYVQDKLALPHSFDVVRGTRASRLTPLAREHTSPAHPVDSASEPLSPPELKALYPRLERIYRRNSSLATPDHPLWAPLVYAYRVGRYRHLVQVIERQRRFRCPAGRQAGVLYPNGDVALCELTRPVGNVVEVGYDLRAVWASEAAEAMRARVERCFCTHGCFQTVAMTREPAMLGWMILAAAGYVFRGIPAPSRERRR